MATGTSTTLNALSTAYRTRSRAPKFGNYAANGNGATTSFAIAHGLGFTPTHRSVQPRSEVANGARITAVDATNITVGFTTAPPTGTGNIKLHWVADALV